jgi:hypothetical protein
VLTEASCISMRFTHSPKKGMMEVGQAFRSPQAVVPAPP